MLLSLLGAAGGLVRRMGPCCVRPGDLLPDLNTALRFDGVLGLTRAGLTRSGLDLVGLDFTTVVAAAAVAGAAALLFGLAPAWMSGAARPVLEHEGRRRRIAGARLARLRAPQACSSPSEIALALVLAVGVRPDAQNGRSPRPARRSASTRASVVSLRVALPSAQDQLDQARPVLRAPARADALAG